MVITMGMAGTITLGILVAMAEVATCRIRHQIMVPLSGTGANITIITTLTMMVTNQERVLRKRVLIEIEKMRTRTSHQKSLELV